MQGKNWKRKLKRANHVTLGGKIVLTTGRNIRGLRGLQKRRRIPPELMDLIEKKKDGQK